jgi:hypothetical protein
LGFLPDKEIDKWADIKSKIKVDPDISSDKTKQLCELFDRFLDVFAWHKGELGYYKIRKHIVDT